MQTLRACGKIVASGTTLVVTKGTALPLFWVYATGTIVMVLDSKTVASAGGANFVTAHNTLALAGVLFLKTTAGNIYQVQSIDTATEIITLKTGAIAAESAGGFTLFCRYDCRAVILTGVTGVTWIGGSDVDYSTTIGIRLNVADPPLILPVTGMADLWVDADSDDDVVSWVCIA